MRLSMWMIANRLSSLDLKLKSNKLLHITTRTKPCHTIRCADSRKSFVMASDKRGCGTYFLFSHIGFDFLTTYFQSDYSPGYTVKDINIVYASHLKDSLPPLHGGNAYCPSLRCHQGLMLEANPISDNFQIVRLWCLPDMWCKCRNHPGV